MARIYIGGAGGAPSNGFIKSLRCSARRDHLIGASSSATDLFLADVEEKYVVPLATDKAYEQAVTHLWQKTKPDFIHVQHDFEVRAISSLRHKLAEVGITVYLPSHATIENCVNKLKSQLIWQEAGVNTPRTMALHNEEDLKKAFATLGDKIWLRAEEGAGGAGALPADSFEFAKNWIDHFNGWGNFMAAELLSKNTVTWLSLWHQGELVVAQGRKRLSWAHGNRTLSGVTGVTGVGVTCAIAEVDSLAQDAIFAIDPKPHGIFAVDMTYDFAGKPKVTEINIGRFFTTHFFFTKAGLNMPEIYTNIALDNNFPSLAQKINPLPNDLVWIRGMDVEPVLTTLQELEKIAYAAD